MAPRGRERCGRVEVVWQFVGLAPVTLHLVRGVLQAHHARRLGRPPPVLHLVEAKVQAGVDKTSGWRCGMRKTCSGSESNVCTSAGRWCEQHSGAACAVPVSGKREGVRVVVNGFVRAKALEGGMSCCSRVVSGGHPATLRSSFVNFATRHPARQFSTCRPRTNSTPRTSLLLPLKPSKHLSCTHMAELND